MYFEELKKTMEWLGQQQDTVFIGQAVSVPGTAMSNTLKGIDQSKLIEFPVAEEMQMGVSIGLAMEKFVPITIFPRWNFLMLAMNQLINHLDKVPELMSTDVYKPRVIVRTGIGSERPLHPQSQHIGDFTEAVRMMATNIEVIRLQEPSDIFPAYQHAYQRTDNCSSLLVEYGDFYNEK